jgi:hypothetical protein
LKKIGRGDLWKQLFRGELDLSNRLATQGAWFTTKIKALTRRLSGGLGFKPAASFGQNSVATLSHRARTLFLFGEGDAGIAALAREFGPNTVPPGATLQIVPGLDHALTSPAMQATAAHHLITFLKQERLSYMSEEIPACFEAAE